MTASPTGAARACALTTSASRGGFGDRRPGFRRGPAPHGPQPARERPPPPLYPRGRTMSRQVIRDQLFALPEPGFDLSHEAHATGLPAGRALESSARGGREIVSPRAATRLGASADASDSPYVRRTPGLLSPPRGTGSTREIIGGGGADPRLHDRRACPPLGGALPPSNDSPEREGEGEGEGERAVRAPVAGTRGTGEMPRRLREGY